MLFSVNVLSSKNSKNETFFFIILIINVILNFKKVINKIFYSVIFCKHSAQQKYILLINYLEL